VIANNTGTFYCNATGKPLVAIYWLKDGSPFDIGVRPDINITFSDAGSNCSLKDPPEECVRSSTVQIYNTMSTDTGNYTCVVSNDYGEQDRSLYLTVKGTLMLHAS